MKLSKEQAQQLMACTTIEEVKAFFQTLGNDITDEEAAAMLNAMEQHMDDKMSSDALEQTAGGMDYEDYKVAEEIMEDVTHGAYSLMTIGFGCIWWDDVK